MLPKFFLPLAVSIIVSLVITPIATRLAKKIGVMDVPKDERRVHKVPLPRLGGLAIYTSLVISTLLFVELTNTIIVVLLGATVIFLTGMLDDIINISPKQKIFGQFVATTLVIIAGIRIEFFDNIPFIENNVISFGIVASIIVTYFWMIGVTNAVNIIDGLDGLASGITIIASFVFAFISYKLGNHTVVIMNLIMAGACIGFLPYNFNPSSIILGDCGSLLLGFMLANISVVGTLKGAALAVYTVPLFVLGFPIFDTGFAMVRRWYNKKPIMEADKGHIHHRLLSLGFGQRKTVMVLYMIGASLGLVGLFIYDQKYLIATGIAGVALYTISTTIRETRGKKDNTEDKGTDNEEEN